MLIVICCVCETRGAGADSSECFFASDFSVCSDKGENQYEKKSHKSQPTLNLLALFGLQGLFWHWVSATKTLKHRHLLGQNAQELATSFQTRASFLCCPTKN